MSQTKLDSFTYNNTQTDKFTWKIISKQIYIHLTTPKKYIYTEIENTNRIQTYKYKLAHSQTHLNKIKHTKTLSDLNNNIKKWNVCIIS